MKKNDDFYYENFIGCAKCSYEAALRLKNVLQDFKPNNLTRYMDELHSIENKGDRFRHELISTLVSAFITPIEREDILELSEMIDDVTDCVEDVLIRFYTNNINSIRHDCMKFCDLLITCCDSVVKLLVEFSHFKKSKNIDALIVEMNELEEKGDRMFIGAMRSLHANENSALDIIAWREVYHYFEKSFDACEHVANIIEGIIIKNS